VVSTRSDTNCGKTPNVPGSLQTLFTEEIERPTLHIVHDVVDDSDASTIHHSDHGPQVCDGNYQSTLQTIRYILSYILLCNHSAPDLHHDL
jgi:hypothetical protein